MNATPSSSAPMPVATAAEAESLSAHLLEVLKALDGVVQEETELVRAGQLGRATQLAERKAELTRVYMADASQLRASRTQLARIVPEKLTMLRQRHDALRALLQINLTVLATAHAVSEGIIRGVSGEMARKAAPQTYGASGRPNLPGRASAPPLAVSRVL